MSEIDDRTRATAKLISSVLLRAFLLGFGLLLVAAFPTVLLTDQLYALHSSLIDVPRPQYNAYLFAWLGDMKMLLFIFFLLPALAIRWTLQKV